MGGGHSKKTHHFPYFPHHFLYSGRWFVVLIPRHMANLSFVGVFLVGIDRVSHTHIYVRCIPLSLSLDQTMGSEDDFIHVEIFHFLY